MATSDLVAFIRDSHLPSLDRRRMEEILADARIDRVGTMQASRRAHHAAISAGIEKDAVIASEELRSLAWGTMWDSTQTEAFELSWVLARLGMGLATIDLVGTDGYTIEDYILLVRPWTLGFPEFPLPRKETA